MGFRARTVNPSVVVLSGLATSPYEYVATPQMLFDAWASVGDLVSGQYFTVNSVELGVAVEFLRLVQQATA